MGTRRLDPISLICRNVMFGYRQNQIHNLWDPVQNANVGPLTQKCCPHLPISQGMKTITGIRKLFSLWSFTLTMQVLIFLFFY